MSYEIKALKIFQDQISKLDEKSRRIIYDKIRLIKENPYHYKRIHSKQYSKVFRVRLSIQQKETRLIYVILEPSIVIVCLLNRKKEYTDLENYLSRIKKEFGP